MERIGHGAKKPGSERAKERKFQGAKVPGSQLASILLAFSLRGANWPGLHFRPGHCSIHLFTTFSISALTDNYAYYNL